MTSPFISGGTTSNTVNIKVNSRRPNAIGNISVPLSSLPDVLIDNTLTSNQTLKFNGTNWINSNSSSGSTTLAALTDTSITGATGGNFLSYSPRLGKWTNSNAYLSALSDCNFGTLSNNQGLIYNGTNWINQQIDHTTLSNIGTNTHAQIDSHVGSFHITSPTNNQVLQYNTSTSKWINATLSTGSVTLSAFN